MRVKPTALVGIGIWILYVAIITTVSKINGVPYDEIGDSTSNLLRGAVVSLVIGGLIVAGLSAWMGWFGAAMRDQHRIRAWWMLIAPALVVVAIVGNLAFTDWGNVPIGFLLAAVALAIGVGFAEEFVCRGMLLVGLRGSFREVVAWALSCLFFGLMHGVNILLGAPAASTVSQIISSVMAGSTFYLLRRYFGSLIPAMILHGLFDLSIFVQSHSGSEGTLLALLDWPAGLIAVIAGLVVALRTDKGPKESYAKGATEVAPVPA